MFSFYTFLAEDEPDLDFLDEAVGGGQGLFTKACQCSTIL
jgi:hypothetical protein